MYAPGIVNIFSGMYILGRELRLIPFDTWAAWAAVSLGAIWLAGAAIQKASDQSERLRKQAGHEEARPRPSQHVPAAASTATKRGSNSAGTQLEREP